MYTSSFEYYIILLGIHKRNYTRTKIKSNTLKDPNCSLPIFQRLYY